MKFIYLFINLPYFWKCKIGISRDWRSRRRSVSRTTKGIALPVWIIYIPFADATEKSLHGFFGRFKSPFKKGSGKTEWFSTLPVLPLAWLIMNLTFLLYWSPIILGVWWMIQKH